MTKPTALSLFCGAGGLSLGFKNSGFDIVFATDFNAFAVKSYSNYFSSTRVLESDIRNLSPASIPRSVDILLGGPPCQGFSSAGQQFWDDPRNKLLREYVRILDAVRPKWFLMENVEGLLTAWNGEYISESVRAMLALGYNVTLEKIYSHAYGVPQRRKRVILVGNRLGYQFEFPAQKHPLRGAIFRKSGTSFQQATSDLPMAVTNATAELEYKSNPLNEFQEMCRKKSGLLSQHYFFEQSGEQQKRIHLLKPGQTMKDLPESMQHPSFRRRAYRRVCDGTPTERRGGAPSGIKRLIAEEPSLTITGAAMREFVHPTEDRTLTLRECARLQTFPDDFRFMGPATEALQQIANAVPPLLAETIGAHIQKKYGFSAVYSNSPCRLRFSLTQSNGMSPALQKTEKLLNELSDTNEQQLELFENTVRYALR